jgi:hypothetical protein
MAKTAQSGWDNLWIILGPNTTTFPGIIPFALAVLAVMPAARQGLRTLPLAAWMIVIAIVAETVLPPLSWAPPHPQYHLQMVAAVGLPIVAMLVGLARAYRGRWLVLLFFIGNAALSAFRYTRYPGY